MTVDDTVMNNVGIADKAIGATAKDAMAYSLVAINVIASGARATRNKVAPEIQTVRVFKTPKILSSSPRLILRRIQGTSAELIAVRTKNSPTPTE